MGILLSWSTARLKDRDLRLYHIELLVLGSPTHTAQTQDEMTIQFMAMLWPLSQLGRHMADGSGIQSAMAIECAPRPRCWPAARTSQAWAGLRDRNPRVGLQDALLSERAGGQDDMYSVPTK